MEFNVNGILWFLNNVWPMVLCQDPELRLIIGGTVCERIPLDKYANVMLLGRVDSLDDFYLQGDVVINPVSQGTGLKIKTFEALSYGKATIVHPHSSQGIFRKDTAPLFIALNPIDWTNIISDIINNINQVKEIKAKEAKYIHEMNDYIYSQYNTYLSDSPK